MSVNESHPGWVRANHARAMMLAEDAGRHLQNGDEWLALLAFCDAYRNEALAAGMCRKADEPSRSVLYRSAATLALNADERGEARRLATLGLEGNPPPEIADELREVLGKCGSVP